MFYILNIIIHSSSRTIEKNKVLIRVFISEIRLVQLNFFSATTSELSLRFIIRSHFDD